MARKDRLGLGLTLVEDREAEAAKDLLRQCSAAEWHLVVVFALSVVALQEDLHSEVVTIQTRSKA